MAMFKNVGELIQLLHEFNPDLPVFTSQWASTDDGKMVEEPADEVIGYRNRVVIQ